MAPGAFRTVNYFVMTLAAFDFGLNPDPLSERI